MRQSGRAGVLIGSAGFAKTANTSPLRVTPWRSRLDGGESGGVQPTTTTAVPNSSGKQPSSVSSVL